MSGFKVLLRLKSEKPKMPWRCFMVEPSEFCRRTLRRFGGNGKSCPTTFPGSMTYHNAEVVIDETFESPGESGRALLKGDYEGDIRWPKYCACGYAFHPEDNWQVNECRLYRGAPAGKLYALREHPPGAIWRATWMEEIQNNPYAAPDGKVWALMMPSGMEWLIYGPEAGGGKWTVTGTLPKITVSPSINQVGVYHGFVKEGIVSEDCEGKKFPKWPSTA